MIILIITIWTTVTKKPFNSLPIVKVYIDTIYIIKDEIKARILYNINTRFLPDEIIWPPKKAPADLPTCELKLISVL